MKFGMGLYWGGMEPEDFIDVARKADECGYDSCGIWEHLIFPVGYKTRYPYHPEGTPSFDADQTLDPFVVLGHVAAVTKRIRLTTSIYILPLRNPFVSAKAVATVDTLSNGRMDLTVGVGWNREEYEVVGENFQDRGPRMEEIIHILRQLWTEEKTEFHGKYYDFPAVHFMPKPAQKPIPILIGSGIEASADKAIRRAARIADGWAPAAIDNSPESVTRAIKKMRGYLHEYGRDKDPFKIKFGGGGWVDIDKVHRYEEAGADEISVSPWFDSDYAALEAKVGPAAAGRAFQAQADRLVLRQRMLDGLERYAEQVIAKVRR